MTRDIVCNKGLTVGRVYSSPSAPGLVCSLIFVVLSLEVLGMKLRVSQMLRKCCTTELHPKHPSWLSSSMSVNLNQRRRGDPVRKFT